MEKFKLDVKSLLGITLTSRQMAAFECYEKELLDWNTRFNLTAIREAESVRNKHFLDSLSCLPILGDIRAGRLIDVGTGAGFPGIPLKIVLPNIQLTLVESVGKKAEFCHHILTTLGLERVDVFHGRAEDLGQNSKFREKYDWAVARAVAYMPTLVEYLIPLVKIGGVVIAQKGESGPAEAQSSEKAINLLGGHLRQVHKVSLPGVTEDRYLIVMDKVAATPPRYPRRVGVPLKKPL